ncbi:MAG: hypothetical protein R2762_07455 [Bryobacteraceae bacterium]
MPNQKTLTRNLLAAAAMVGLLAWLVDSRPVTAQAPSRGRPNPDERLFRITVGLTDAAGKEWAGRLQVSGGQIAALEGWRFSGADQASATGEFRFRTKIGNLENQLRTNIPYGQTDWGDPSIRRLVPQGLLLLVRGPETAQVRFEVEGSPFEFTVSNAAYHRPLTFLDGNARVERLAPAETWSEPLFADDEPVVALGARGQRYVAWLSYRDKGDYVTVSDGTDATRVTDKGDHQGPALAVDTRGWVHAAWSQREGAEWHVYLSTRVGGRWTAAQKMSEGGGSNIAPVLAAGAAGRIGLAWQSLREGRSTIRYRELDGRRWGPEQAASEGGGNAWSPAIAFGSGKMWIAWDAYDTGAYQIYARASGSAVERVTAGSNFSVRPSIAIDPRGVPVVAWEESGPMWGKDYAFLTDTRGTRLYESRRIVLGYRDGGTWKRLSADPAAAIAAWQRRYLQQPRIVIDPAGRLHMAFRVRTSASTSRMDGWAAGGRWHSFYTRMDGDRWLPAVEMAQSVGRNSMRASIAANNSAVEIAWATDDRPWADRGEAREVDVRTASFTAGGAESRLSGEAMQAASAALSTHPNEKADTQRIRAHRITIAGKTYRIVRGDLHRHTELSADGSGDGMLEDLYRYTMDAAAMDYAHVGDHQMGSDDEYNWWFTQKSNDLYHMPDRFVVLYGYERSVRYPNGHRNVIWAERGHPVLRIGPQEQQGKLNTGSLLYPYLKRTRGIATSHTSATPQGTDWRDNDPDVEPIVEIYQAFESSYEHPGAPRAWKEGDKPVHTGLRPAGYVWNAWAKGYKLGVQSSSDHVATHTSYACILVEDFTREGLVDAMRRRHTYAATDSIILDVRMNGTALMGDAIESAGSAKLQVRAIGTAPIAEIDVIRDNKYVHKVEPNTAEASFEYVDPSADAGESYYYVRVRQTDGQLAWSSPIWVKR